MPIQIPVTVRIPPVLAPGVGITATLQNGTLALSFTDLTTQVQKQAITAFSGIPKASWRDFVATYGGNVADSDGAYQALIAPVAPVNGVLWGMMLAYLEGIGQTPLQATTILTSIWALAPNQPL